MSQVWRAFRYSSDGVLVDCKDHGDRFVEPIHRSREELRIELRALPPPTPRVGCYTLDLVREAKRSGVPAWFRRELSRRRRCVEWAKLQAMRAKVLRRADSVGGPVDREAFAYLEAKRAAGWIEPVAMRTRMLVGHRFRFFFQDGCPSGDVLLYLPQGEEPTERHGRELGAFLMGRRPLTVADLRQHLGEVVVDRLVGVDAISAQVRWWNEQRPASTEGARRTAAMVIWERLCEERPALRWHMMDSPMPRPAA